MCYALLYMILENKITSKDLISLPSQPIYSFILIYLVIITLHAQKIQTYPMSGHKKGGGVNIL